MLTVSWSDYYSLFIDFERKLQYVAVLKWNWMMNSLPLALAGSMMEVSTIVIYIKIFCILHPSTKYDKAMKYE